ncbi:hypothetical protein ACQKWADRAFT_280849 [Trichoderma austrokoningii]
MSTERNDYGSMNPTAAPFIPFASTQPSFATQRPKIPRSSVLDWRHGHEETALPVRNQVMSSVYGKGYSAPPSLHQSREPGARFHRPRGY